MRWNLNDCTKGLVTTLYNYFGKLIKISCSVTLLYTHVTQYRFMLEYYFMIFQIILQDANISIDTLKITIDCSAAGTWVEIDAVELVGTIPNPGTFNDSSVYLYYLRDFIMFMNSS